MWKYMKLAFEKVQHSCGFAGFRGDTWRYGNWPIYFDPQVHVSAISFKSSSILNGLRLPVPLYAGGKTSKHVQTALTQRKAPAETASIITYTVTFLKTARRQIGFFADRRERQGARLCRTWGVIKKRTAGAVLFSLCVGLCRALSFQQAESSTRGADSSSISAGLW